MVSLTRLLDVMLHVDKYLGVVFAEAGGWTYLVMFLVIFCETGLVVAPFLPGDSLLFGLGAFAAQGFLRVEWLFVVLAFAAVLGDAVNYAIGFALGGRVLEGRVWWVRMEYVARTQRFFTRYGGKTVFLARFVPVVRTFAPFLAGVGRMAYRRFFVYNVTGGVVWTGLFVFGGYVFGGLPWVRENFSLTIVVIIVVSFVPVFVEVWRHRRARRRLSLSGLKPKRLGFGSERVDNEVDEVLYGPRSGKGGR